MPRNTKFAIAVLLAVGLLGAMYMALSRRTNATLAFEKLVDEMHDAQEAHIDAVIAERNRRDAGETAPAGAASPDRRPGVYERMVALAQKTEAAPEGANIALGVLAWGAEVGAAPQTLAQAFRRIARNYPNDPVVDTAIDVIERLADGSPEPAAFAPPLDELVTATKSKSTRIAALMALGRVRLRAGDTPGAKSAFQSAVAAQPPTETEKRAKGALFEIEHLQIGMQAPDFTTRTLDDKDLALASFRGKTVLVNFWASWCPTCVGEIPRLKDVADRLKDRPFEMLSVSLDHTRQEAESVIKAMQMPGVATWHSVEDRNPVADLYNIYVLPAWFLLDAQGVIRARDPFGEKLLPAIEAALAQSDPRP